MSPTTEAPKSEPEIMLTRWVSGLSVARATRLRPWAWRAFSWTSAFAVIGLGIGIHLISVDATSEAWGPGAKTISWSVILLAVAIGLLWLVHQIDLRLNPNTEPLAKHVENIGAAILSWALTVGMVVGLWHGGEILWKGAFPGPSFVECHAGGKLIYSGISIDGLSSGWNSKSLTEWGTGQKIRLDSSATCVERELPAEETAKLNARK